VRWWQIGLGGALVVWLLGTAYWQARRRGRRIGAALFFLAAAVLLFAAASFLPRPPLTPSAGSVLIVGSVVSLGLAMAIILWHGLAH